MVNSKAKLPKEQKCQFIVGPNSSWNMPSIMDIWSQPKSSLKRATAGDSGEINVSHVDPIIMDCDNQQNVCEDNASLSYLIYGCIGCFCYGEIHYQLSSYSNGSSKLLQQQHQFRPQSEQPSSMSACINRLIDFKEDNSRVSCARFLKTSMYPIAMILTERGSFLFHDCLSSENLVQFKESELINKLLGPQSVNNDDSSDGGHRNKKQKCSYGQTTQQFISCLWPTPKDAYLSVFSRKEKTNYLFWLKVKDLTELRSNPQSIIKDEFIESHVKLDLELPESSSPVCCMESAILDSETCLIAVAMDDGLITVVKINFQHDKVERVIKLMRHKRGVSSMSFFVGNNKKYPLGLLASVCRDGLMLVWDINNEFYFADYRAGSRIDWFALSFLPLRESTHINLVVSNCDNGLSVIELPGNTRSRVSLRERKKEEEGGQTTKRQHNVSEQTLRHHALLFNLVFDPITQTLVTSSLDANYILWNCRQLETGNKIGIKKDNTRVEVKPQFLFPSMKNESRTHMLRHSPIREDLLGIALGKAGVRFYKVAANPMQHRFDMNSSCGLISRKITKDKVSPTSIAWHPSHEYRVAIGTLEGKVLRADITPRKATIVEAEHNRVTSSSNYNMEQDRPIEGEDFLRVEYRPLDRPDDEIQLKTGGVYSLCWGPDPAYPQDISRLAIYAIGSISHRLFIYNHKKDNCDKLTNYLDEFLDQSLPEAIGEASEVAWKSSMDLMALGTTKGKIYIVSYLEESHADRSKNNLFKKLAVIQGPLGHTHIQCLVWHPATDKDDPQYYYIAASANESPAFVFNIKEILLVADVNARLRIDPSTVITAGSTVSTYMYKLDGHTKAISDIAWSPHEPLELATSSFDRNCLVWSLNDNEESPDARIISKFSARDRLFTLEWSLVDSDIIFTSGHDSTIWAWRPSENRAKTLY